MKSILSLSLTLATAALAASAPAAEIEKPATSRIASIGLFKNGLAYVHRVVKLQGSGVYKLDRLPRPVHGTFWVESDAKIATRTTEREVEVALTKSENIAFQDDLAGREVTVFFTAGKIPPATGRVIAQAQSDGDDQWSRSYESFYNWWYYQNQNPGQRPAATPSRFLILETAQGRAYVDSKQIAYLEAKGAKDKVTRKRPVMLIEVPASAKGEVTVTISYLTKGIAWAPSYNVDISDDKKLHLQQKAIIKNELEDFTGARLKLISGFPSIQFSHVTSPLSPGTNWATFFQQLNQRVGVSHAMASNVLSQQVIMSNAVRPSFTPDLSAVPTGEGVDLHYHDIGPQSMQAGDALALEVAAADAEYERIAEWIVPDTRNPNGQRISEHEINQNPDKYDDSPWDAVRFRNPLKFPMTTAAAMITAGDRFNGLRTSYWTNSGEEATLRITKALSIRTRQIENESAVKDRDYIYVGGRRFRKVRVSGELLANNHRNETVTLLIRRRFSGELVSVEGDPRKSLLETGVYSVNKRQELAWEKQLKPGGEIKLTYKYDVLVYH